MCLRWELQFSGEVTVVVQPRLAVCLISNFGAHCTSTYFVGRARLSRGAGTTGTSGRSRRGRDYRSTRKRWPQSELSNFTLFRFILAHGLFQYVTVGDCFKSTYNHEILHMYLRIREWNNQYKYFIFIMIFTIFINRTLALSLLRIFCLNSFSPLRLVLFIHACFKALLW